MNALVPFAFDGAPIRAFPIDGDPWFVGKDVASALGYANPREAIRDHCKAAKPAGGSDSRLPPLDPQTVIIPERDVYRLIMRSKLPSAERFEELVVGEILPSIRKTGSYGAPRPKPRAVSGREVRASFDFGLALAERIGLHGNQALLAANGLTRKTTGIDVLAEMGQAQLVAPQQEVLLAPTDIGVELGGLSAIKVNHLLATHGFQIGRRSWKGKNSWEPTEKGEQVGGVMVDVARPNGTGNSRQLRWASGIVDTLRELGAA